MNHGLDAAKATIISAPADNPKRKYLALAKRARGNSARLGGWDLAGNAAAHWAGRYLIATGGHLSPAKSEGMCQSGVPSRFLSP